MVLLLIATLMVAVIPAYAAGEPSDNALTRGSRFTVNITGLPSTPYYIWLEGRLERWAKTGLVVIRPLHACAGRYSSSSMGLTWPRTRLIASSLFIVSRYRFNSISDLFPHRL